MHWTLVTHRNGKEIFINLEHVEMISPIKDGGANIIFATEHKDQSEQLVVRESPSDVFHNAVKLKGITG